MLTAGDMQDAIKAINDSYAGGKEAGRQEVLEQVREPIAAVLGLLRAEGYYAYAISFAGEFKRAGIDIGETKT